MKRLKSEKGFTLIEIMVVLIIIIVLIVLGVTGMRIVQQVSRDTARRAFARDLQLLFEDHHEKELRYPHHISIDPGGCSSGETEITSHLENNAEVSRICSNVNFDVNIDPGDCSDFTGNEEESGDLTMCYLLQSQGYLLYVRLERTDTPYNASNEETT